MSAIIWIIWLYGRLYGLDVRAVWLYAWLYDQPVRPTQVGDLIACPCVWSCVCLACGVCVRCVCCVCLCVLCCVFCCVELSFIRVGRCSASKWEPVLFKKNLQG